jgi:tetratricopeptide (TPR) repeat protein
VINWEDLGAIEKLREEGRLSEAMARLEALSEKAETSEDQVPIMLNQALCCCDLHQFAEAVEIAERANFILPADSSLLLFARFCLGCVYERNGELDRAAEHFRNLLREFHNVPLDGSQLSTIRDTQHRLIAILLLVGGPSEALSLIGALKTGAGSPEELAELEYREALALSLLGHNDFAVRQFQKALSGPLLPAHAFQSHFRIAEIFFNEGEHRNAICTFQKALELVPNDSEEAGLTRKWIEAARRMINPS